MKKLILDIYHKAGISSSRTRNIANHIGISFFLKGGSIIANFLLVPLSINYLNATNYGIWLTLSSFIAWFSFFDIGLGNGLRNKFAEARVAGDDLLAKTYVSVAYYTIGAISLFVISFFLLLNLFVDWTKVFNTGIELQSELKILMPVVFSFFGLQLVLKLITTIYTADQNHSFQGKIQFLTQVISLIAIWILTKMSNSSLLIFGGIFSALPVLALLVFNIIAFKGIYRAYKPNIKLYKKKYLKNIMGLGINFFIIQIAALILFSTDNFIITHLFSSAEVVPYNIAFKYFSIMTMVYTIIITPYWSSFTEAYARKDFDWIKTSVNTIQKIWLLIPLGLCFMLYVADWFYFLWVGNVVKVPLSLSLGMALFVLLLTFNTIYTYFMNGVGKIKIQLIISVIIMFANIPLSILFADILRFGSSGVIFASCLCLIPSAILFPKQYRKIINNEAYGIWNK